MLTIVIKERLNFFGSFIFGLR